MATKKERVADLLRAQGQSPAAERLMGLAALGRAEFGHHAQVIVDEKFGGTTLTVGVNWSAMGTRDAETTAEFVHMLQMASEMANAIQAILDAPEEEATS